MILQPLLHRNQNFLLSLSLLITLSFTESACSTTRIVSRYDSNRPVNNSVNKRTTWTYAWGLVQPKDIDPKCEASANYMTKVTVKTNLGYIFLSAITLGIVIPQHVEWACSPPVLRPEILGN